VAGVKGKSGVYVRSKEVRMVQGQNWSKGTMKLTSEQRIENARKASLARWAKVPFPRPRELIENLKRAGRLGHHALKKRQGPTWMERALFTLLREAGLSFCTEFDIGDRTVDAWVPSHRLVFEADCSFWHKSQAREDVRDLYLMRRGVMAVIHLDEEDLGYLRRLV